MENVQMHESLVDVVDNGDGTFTISRGKLVSLVQGQVFMDIYDDADVDEVNSGMDRAYRRVLGSEFESAQDYAVAQVAAFEAARWPDSGVFCGASPAWCGIPVQAAHVFRVGGCNSVQGSGCTRGCRGSRCGVVCGASRGVGLAFVSWF